MEDIIKKVIEDNQIKNINLDLYKDFFLTNHIAVMKNGQFVSLYHLLLVSPHPVIQHSLFLKESPSLDK